MVEATFFQQQGIYASFQKGEKFLYLFGSENGDQWICVNGLYARFCPPSAEEERPSETWHALNKVQQKIIKGTRHFDRHGFLIPKLKVSRPGDDTAVQITLNLNRMSGYSIQLQYTKHDASGPSVQKERFVVGPRDYCPPLIRIFAEMASGILRDRDRTLTLWGATVPLESHNKKFSTVKRLVK